MVAIVALLDDSVMAVVALDESGLTIVFTVMITLFDHLTMVPIMFRRNADAAWTELDSLCKTGSGG